MLFAVLNCIMFGSVFLANWVKNKQLNAYSYIVLIWSISALLGCFLMSADSTRYNLAFWPFLYLFVVFLVFIWPFKEFNLNPAELVEADNQLLRILAWVYVVTGILSIYYTYPYAIANFSIADWDVLKDEIYLDDDSLILYHSTFEKLIKNINSYIETFAIVYAFYLLTRPKANKLLSLLIFLSFFGYTFLGSVLEAGRGRIAKLILDTMMLYFVFHSYIERKTKKLIQLAFFTFVGLVSMYLVAVTVSRFGERGGGGSSVLSYLGHSMLNFNDGIAQHIQRFAGGKRFLKWIFDFIGINSSYGNLEHQAGSGFVTFIGNFYMDFGPVGTALLAIGMLPIISFFTRKKHYRFSDLVVILFFAEYYLNGIFVYGSGTSLQWVMTFVLYGIIRGLESIRKL